MRAAGCQRAPSPTSGVEAERSIWTDSMYAVLRAGGGRASDHESLLEG